VRPNWATAPSTGVADLLHGLLAVCLIAALAAHLRFLPNASVRPRLAAGPGGLGVTGAAAVYPGSLAQTWQGAALVVPGRLLDDYPFALQHLLWQRHGRGMHRHACRQWHGRSELCASRSCRCRQQHHQMARLLMQISSRGVLCCAGVRSGLLHGWEAVPALSTRMTVRMLQLTQVPFCASSLVA